MTRAQEAAMKAYPIEICGYTTECRVGAMPIPLDWNEVKRESYQEGYEQAEKDLINHIRKQVETWMPERDGDEHTEGKRLAFRSVLNLLKEMEDEE